MLLHDEGDILLKTKICISEAILHSIVIITLYFVSYKAKCTFLKKCVM